MASLVLPEFRPAPDRRRRRDELSADEAEEIWNRFAAYPISWKSDSELVDKL